MPSVLAACGSSPRNGDGVCDEDLNVAQCGYDKGDCCRLTCRFNPARPGSCIDTSFRCHDPRGCDDGSDKAPPEIVGVPPSPTDVQECAANGEQGVPPWPQVSAVDNDPAFVAAVARTQTVTPLPGCTGTFRLTRNWSIKDAAQNSAQASFQATYRDSKVGKKKEKKKEEEREWVDGLIFWFSPPRRLNGTSSRRTSWWNAILRRHRRVSWPGSTV